MSTASAVVTLLILIFTFFQKVIEAFKPSPRDYGVDQKLLSWCQGQLKGFVYLMIL